MSSHVRPSAPSSIVKSQWAKAEKSLAYLRTTLQERDSVENTEGFYGAHITLPEAAYYEILWVSKTYGMRMKSLISQVVVWADITREADSSIAWGLSHETTAWNLWKRGKTPHKFRIWLSRYTARRYTELYLRCSANVTIRSDVDPLSIIVVAAWAEFRRRNIHLVRIEQEVIKEWSPEILGFKHQKTHYRQVKVKVPSDGEKPRKKLHKTSTTSTASSNSERD